MAGILWIFFSYLLGSFPSGYIFSRLSGKNVLEVGWKKTSGSNVFKNVGKRQGLLTAVFDILKGYSAVYFAQQMGFSLEVQVFSGVAAVLGHNWSIFLKLSGGRGIGTFIGAFAALSPQLLLYSLIPLLFTALIWNAAIGTILFLALALCLSFYLNQFEPGGFFVLLSLVPIFIKRLSPTWKINSFRLLKNRLIFDNDEGIVSFRIKRLFHGQSWWEGKNNDSR
ncbi:MAG: glycerol-3-phosphate acyltransferase [bacterium]